MHKIKFILFFIITVCFASSSCRVAEKIINPVKTERKEIVKKNYEKDGLSFSHPDNWQITEDKILEDGIRYVNIEDANNSIVSITLFDSDSVIDLDEYAETFVKEMSDKIPIGKIADGATTEVNRTINGQELTGVRRRFSISLLNQAVLHTTDFFSIDGEKSNAVVVIQAPDEDRQAAEKEFQTILDSLKF